MRLVGRSPLQLALMGLGLVLLLVAAWGMLQRYPNFEAEHVERTRLTIPAPSTAP